jgi:DNA invertase Pin-like site-specific DNA recombinase
MSTMLLGYARVSTDDQHLELQRDALNGAGCERLFEDRVSAVRAERTGLKQLLDVARRGDTLVVWRLDRLYVFSPRRADGEGARRGG